jgi:murein DD-endopeptidase MepM/ murein hydrolase activator NlpD
MLNKYIKYIKVIVVLAAALAVILVIAKFRPQPPVLESVIPAKQQDNSASQTQPATSPALAEPLGNALARVTKKPFGIYITPRSSPVQPERFQGYHTGVDFETYPNEQNVDVPVAAVCDGTLLTKKWASGYGGVAVQSCVLDSQPVTVIYGHLRLSSITAKTGTAVKAGDKIAVLGTGYSSETDGERKHLHLGIHRGAAINLLGYVQRQSDLSGWLDAQKYLK